MRERRIRHPAGRSATPLPPIVRVVGRKNSGKTTLAVELIRELVARGLRVGSAKHGHGFELDRAGTDSWRHRHEGGAFRTVLAGPEDVAVLGRWGPDGEPSLETLVARALPDADVVVAEGWKVGPGPRIEVWRAALHPEPLYARGRPDAADFWALVTDRPERIATDGTPRIVRFGDPERATLLAELVMRRLSCR